MDLHIANCGGAVLKWQAGFDVDWIEVDAPGGTAVTAGAEVAVGTTYTVHLARTVGGGPQGVITLTGGVNGPPRWPGPPGAWQWRPGHLKPRASLTRARRVAK